MVSTDYTEVEFVWEDLNPSQPDRHQNWVGVLGFFLLMFGFPISMIITPYSIFLQLFGLTCMAYGRLIGNTWYRNEMLPYLMKTIDISDLEEKRFLNHCRYGHLSLLVAGVLSLILPDLLFRSYLPTFVILALVDFMYAIYALILVTVVIIFYVFQIFLWMLIFNRILSSIYSDVSHLFEYEQRRRKHDKDKKRKNQNLGPVRGQNIGKSAVA